MTQRSVSAAFLYSAANNAPERRITSGFVYVARVGTYVIPPTAPSGLSGVVTGYTGVDVSWTDNSDDETGFELQRSTTSGFSSGISTVSLPPGTTSYSFSGLTHNTTYYIRVRAVRSASRSLFSTPISLKTWNGIPAAPTHFQATSVTPEAISFSWTDNATNETRYELQFTPGGAWMWWPGDLPANAESATLAQASVSLHLAPGVQYAFRAVSVNSYGFGYSNYVWITAPESEEPPPLDPPTAPTNLQVTGVELMAISLVWTDGSSDEDGFWIDRSQDGEIFSTVATVGAGVTSYTDPWLMPDTRYYYQVRAYRGELISSPSNMVQAETLGVEPPTNLTAEALSATSVHLTWQDNAQVEQAYTIERSVDNGQSWLEIGKVPANQTRYTDTNLSPETWCCYRVRALYPLLYLRSGLHSGRGLDLYDETLYGGAGGNVPIPDGWQTVAFDDSAWTPGLHFGYGAYPPMVAPGCYIVKAYPGFSSIGMRGNLIRSRFTLPQGPLISARLRINIEDLLFGCYINGVEVVPPLTHPAYNTAYNRADVSIPPSVFQPGPNVLAIHFVNESGIAHAVSYLLEIY